MGDAFQGRPQELDSPATIAFAITPSDTVDLPNNTRGIWIGAAGNIAVTLIGMPSGTSVIFVGATVGSILPLRASRIWATGTSATSMVGIA